VVVAGVLLGNWALSEPTLPRPRLWWAGRPSFQTDVLPILEKRCLMCHGGQGAAPAFAHPEETQNQACFTCHTTSLPPDLKTYGEIMAYRSDCGGTPLVVPGDPDSSFLMHKISTTTPLCGGPMPPTGRLPDQELTLIRDWIAKGARE